MYNIKWLKSFIKFGTQCGKSSSQRSLTILADWGTNGMGVNLRTLPLVSRLIYSLLASPERTPWPLFWKTGFINVVVALPPLQETKHIPYWYKSTILQSWSQNKGFLNPALFILNIFHLIHFWLDHYCNFYVYVVGWHLYGYWYLVGPNTVK